MKKQVMVVDDDKFIRIAVRELFESEGYEVVTAECAEECLNQLQKGFKGVILVDIMMPGKDGWDTIREIIDNGLFEGNIISMLTAKDVPDEKMDGLQEFVTDYITKPFNPEAIVSTVNEYFGYLSDSEC